MARKKRIDSVGRVLRVGEGQRKEDGIYSYRYTDNSGKRITVYAPTLVELRDKEKQIERDLQDGINTAEANRLTLNQLFEIYISTKMKLRDTTRDSYIATWKKHVQESFLGEMKVANIKKMHIDKFYADLDKAGFAKGTKRYINSFLSPCLQVAVDSDIIRKNPAAKVEITGEEKKIEALTIEQQTRLLDFVKKNGIYNVYYPMIFFDLSTGLRIGELTGLTWSDVDLKKENIVDVNHQLRYVKKGDKVRFVITDLKTDAAERKIPLTSEARQALINQKELCLMLGRRSSAEIDGKKGFIFVTKNGTPFSTYGANTILNNIVEAYNKAEAKAAGEEYREPVQMPHISAHVLRHTACTRMAESGIDPKTLQYIMGHSDISTTMNIYNHTDSVRVKNEMQKAEGIIKYG